MPDQPDVLVIGGGPAGSTTAARLARAGLRVALVDRARFPREKACAEYASPKVARLLRELGFGSLAAVRGSRPLRGMRIHSSAGASHLVDYADVPADARPFAVRRFHLDQALLEHAARCGAEVHEGSRAVAIGVPSGGRVAARIAQGGAERTWLPRIVVGADGLRSIVCRVRGWEAPLRWPKRLGLVTHYEGVAGPAETGSMFAGPASYCGIAPLGDGSWSVAAVVPLGRGGTTPVEQLFESTVRAHPALAAQLDGAKRIDAIRGVGPMAKRVGRASGGQAVLVGDAAGFFDPFTGEGIHRAIRSGQIAAETIVAALERGDLTDRRLAAYDRRRAAELAPKERLCALVQVFVSRPRLLGFALRRLEDRRGVAATLARLLGDLAPVTDRVTARLALQLML